MKIDKKDSDTLGLDSMDISSQFKVQSVINSQILEQLQKIGKRLDKIERHQRRFKIKEVGFSKVGSEVRGKV